MDRIKYACRCISLNSLYSLQIALQSASATIAKHSLMQFDKFVGMEIIKNESA